MNNVSVIIPTQNDPLIGTVIASVQKELGEDTQILVVGLDDTGLLSQMSTIKFIDTGGRVGASTARNIGIEEAKSEWLTFIDSDCIVLPGWAEALEPHLAGRPKAIGGGVAFRLHIYWQLVYNISMFHEFLAQLAPSQRRYLPTLNLTVHRDVIRDTGLLDERLIRGQDVDWTIRMALAGYELHFEPRAAVLHFPQRIDLYTVLRYWYSDRVFQHPQPASTCRVPGHPGIHGQFPGVAGAVARIGRICHGEHVRRTAKCRTLLAHDSRGFPHQTRMVSWRRIWSQGEQGRQWRNVGAY